MFELPFAGVPGYHYGFAVQRCLDGLFFNTNTQQFEQSPQSQFLFTDMTEIPPPLLGAFRIIMPTSDAKQWTNGIYNVWPCLYRENLQVLAPFQIELNGGTDARIRYMQVYPM